MWTRGRQRSIYDCSEDSTENYLSNEESQPIQPSFYDYWNPHTGYAYPNFNHYNWPAYNYYYANPEYIASLWHHYFFGNGGYEHQDVYEAGFWGHPASDFYHYCPPIQEYDTVPEVWSDIPQRVPIYSTSPSRNSATPRSSPDLNTIKEQRLPNHDPNEFAFSAASTSNSPETVPNTTNSSSGNSPTISTSSDESFVGPIATVYGTMSIYLRQKIRVDLTIDRAIMLTNYSTGTIASMSSDGCNICLIHENGKALLENHVVHSRRLDIMAKITKRGVIFTTEKNSLVYLVDDAGTKSTSERFRDLDRDISRDLFYYGSTHGPEVVDDCYCNITKGYFRKYPHGDEVWNIAGVRIQQQEDGEVKISRDFGNFTLRMSPTCNSVSASTYNVFMSAGFKDDKQLFVRQGEKRLTWHKDGFTVRHGSQKAGFDQDRQIILP